IILNLVKSKEGARELPWTDSVVISSTFLLAWLLAATIFEWLYKPAQQGRKVAYLTVASFVFLAVVLAMVLGGSSQHAGSSQFKVQSSQFKVEHSATLNFELRTLNLFGLEWGDRT